MATNVSIKLTVGIPSAVVFFQFAGIGGAYNGGVKCSPNAIIDLDKAGSSSLSVAVLAWEKTYSYANADALVVAGKPDWYRTLRAGAAPTGTATLELKPSNLNIEYAQLSGATHAIKFTVVGANPLLAVAPAIDAEITVGLRKSTGGIQFSVQGDHDGFPNYTLQINGNTVYAWDCVAVGEDPSALGPPMDQSVKITWKNL